MKKTTVTLPLSLTSYIKSVIYTYEEIYNLQNIFKDDLFLLVLNLLKTDKFSTSSLENERNKKQKENERNKNNELNFYRPKFFIQRRVL